MKEQNKVVQFKKNLLLINGTTIFKQKNFITLFKAKKYAY